MMKLNLALPLVLLTLVVGCYQQQYSSSKEDNNGEILPGKITCSAEFTLFRCFKPKKQDVVEERVTSTSSFNNKETCKHDLIKQVRAEGRDKLCEEFIESYLTNVKYEGE